MPADVLLYTKASCPFCVRAKALLEEFKTRPLFRAVDTEVDVVFVPYTQLDGISRGSRVIACSLLLVGCRDVGTIRELIAGEVVTQDPWGNLMRGQYAVLDLTEPAAVRQKVLRVRKS